MDSRLNRRAVVLLAAVIAAMGPIAHAQRAASAPQRASAAADSQPQEVQRLASWGVSASPESLIGFLQSGLPDSLDLARLPEQPEERTQLAVDAMAILGARRSGEAVAVLTQVVAGPLPGGAVQLLEMDLARTAPESRGQFQQKALQILRFNGVVALGLIGDPAGLQAVRGAFGAESNNAFRLQYAIALAGMGDASGLDFVVGAIPKSERREAAAAARAFTIITGEDFGIGPSTATRAREQRAKRYGEWWRLNQRSFRPDPEAIRQRRQAPDPALTMTPRTTRDLVNMASFRLDVGDRTRSRDAQQKLQQAGTAINKDLERLASDSMEDINIRMEAISLYTEFNGMGARDLLRKLRRDGEREVAERADFLLMSLEASQATRP